MRKVLILCTGNSCRSQMAEGFLKTFAPRLDVRSAGTLPAAFVHPLAVQVMAEAGIDISSSRPKNVDQFLDEEFDAVITVCDNARETCPVFSGTVGRKMHVSFEDPAAATGTDAEILEIFRRVRDEIRDRFQQLSATWEESADSTH